LLIKGVINGAGAGTGRKAEYRWRTIVGEVAIEKIQRACEKLLKRTRYGRMNSWCIAESANVCCSCEGVSLQKRVYWEWDAQGGQTAHLLQ